MQKLRQDIDDVERESMDKNKELVVKQLEFFENFKQKE